jgi:hypothetical protein
MLPPLIEVIRKVQTADDFLSNQSGWLIISTLIGAKAGFNSPNGD